MSLTEVDKALIAAAREVRKEAYAPYSGYAVGAAILDANGRVWTGVNVENASYGATLCAERSAVMKMVTAGVQEIAILAVATTDGGTPCGICRQVLLEFSPDPSRVRVLAAGDQGETREYSLEELIPFGFKPDLGKRTDQGRS